MDSDDALEEVEEGGLLAALEVVLFALETDMLAVEVEAVELMLALVELGLETEAASTLDDNADDVLIEDVLEGNRAAPEVDEPDCVLALEGELAVRSDEELVQAGRNTHRQPPVHSPSSSHSGIWQPRPQMGATSSVPFFFGSHSSKREGLMTPSPHESSLQVLPQSLPPFRKPSSHSSPASTLALPQ